jgi:hypothetical protein
MKTVIVTILLCILLSLLIIGWPMPTSKESFTDQQVANIRQEVAVLKQRIAKIRETRGVGGTGTGAWRFASASGFDILTSDGGSGNSKEFMALPPQFVSDIPLVAVHAKNFPNLKYHWLDILLVHPTTRQIRRGQVYVFDECTNAACPPGSGKTCCTTNARLIKQAVGAPAFLLDLERHGTLRHFGFDLMTSSQGVIAIAFRVLRYENPEIYQQKYKASTGERKGFWGKPR